MIFFQGSRSTRFSIALLRKRGVGESTSTVYDTDRMESSQQRKESKVKYLCLVDLWVTFLHLPASSHCMIHTHI